MLPSALKDVLKKRKCFKGFCLRSPKKITIKITFSYKYFRTLTTHILIYNLLIVSDSTTHNLHHKKSNRMNENYREKNGINVCN